MSPERRSPLVSALVLLAAFVSVASIQAQAPPPTSIRVARGETPPLRLRQIARVGSLDGRHDAFGRVMDAALDSRGRLIVADDLNHHVVVFDRAGRFVGTAGRWGEGPGEMESPWEVAVGRADSVYVWDVALARVSVFSPALEFARSFPVPPEWTVGSMDVLPSGELLVVSYAGPGAGMLHRLDPEGRPLGSFGPRPPRSEGLAGFESSLLGGTAALGGGRIVFSNKSPYEIWTLSVSGEAQRRCVGAERWATPPADVVETTERGQALRWNRFVHSSRVFVLPDGRILNQTLDPGDGKATLDLLDSDCTLLRRTRFDSPTKFVSVHGNRFVAVRTLEYPEVIVYEDRQSAGRSASTSNGGRSR